MANMNTLLLAISEIPTWWILFVFMPVSTTILEGLVYPRANAIHNRSSNPNNRPNTRMGLSTNNNQLLRIP